MAKLARLCEHDRFNQHFLMPTVEAVAAGTPDVEVRCTGGAVFEIDWTAAYTAGEWMDRKGIPDFEKAVEAIVNAALGLPDVG